jgi:hypothetical protein
MIPVLDGYKGKNVSRPSTEITPKEKGEGYGLAWSRYLFALYCDNQTSLSSLDVTRFSRNRSYSLGKQPTDQYKSWLINDYNSDSGSSVAVSEFDDTPYSRVSKRMGWTNVNFDDPQSPAPAIMDALHGALDKMDYDCYVNTIDENSKGLAEDEKYRKMVEAAFSDWQIEYKKKAGMPVDEEVVYPKSREEFEMFEAEEGFKPAVAKTMQKLLRHSFEISDWDGETRKNIIDDLICLGYAAVQDYYDASARKWKVKWLDPANLIMQYSNSRGYKDADFAAYYSPWTISSLRAKLPHVPERELLALAKTVTGKYGNPYRWDETKMSELDPTTKLYKNIEGWKVPVLECAWIDFDSENHLYYRNRHGRDLVIPLGDKEPRPLSEESIKLGAKQELKRVGMRVPRECCWVIDTDYVFDYGIIKMADRPTITEPQLPFHAEQLLTTCIMERLIPILDEIEQLYLRWQNSLAMMIEGGLQINTALMENVNYGGGKMPIQDVVKMGMQTGKWLYSYMSQSGVPGMYGGGAATPITEIKGGLGDRVTQTMTALEMAFKKVELFTGFNLATLGISPQAGVPAGDVNEAMQSTLNVLKPILDGALEVKQSCGSSMMRRIQTGIRNDQGIRDAYAGVVGKTEVETMRLMEKNYVEYGLSLKPKPDGKMKAMFYGWMEESVANTKAGNVELNTSDKLWLATQLEAGGDILDLTRQMRYRIKKNQEEYQKQQESNIALQGQVQDQTIARQHKMKLEEMAMEREGSIQEEVIRGTIKDKESTKQALINMYERLWEGAAAEQGLTTKTSK